MVVVVVADMAEAEEVDGAGVTKPLPYRRAMIGLRQLAVSRYKH